MVAVQTAQRSARSLTVNSRPSVSEVGCRLPKSWTMTQRRASQGGNVPRNRFHEEAELFQKRAHPPRMRAHFDHHMGRWASKEEGPKRFANRLDGFRSFDSAVRPKNAQSALLVSQIASNHRSGTFRHGRSLLAPSSALKPADYLLGLKERPPHPISVGRAACVAQNPH